MNHFSFQPKATVKFEDGSVIEMDFLAAVKFSQMLLENGYEIVDDEVTHGDLEKGR